MSTYYRNIESNTYHLPAPTWVRTGKAMCGRQLRMPSHFVQGTDLVRPGRGICIDCLKVEGELLQREPPFAKEMLERAIDEGHIDDHPEFPTFHDWNGIEHAEF